jgi:hypothetical protein
LDSDIILPRNFLEMVSKFMSPKVGAIQGKRSLHHEFWGSVIRSRVGRQSYRVLKPGDRPFTGATLVRTECARGADLSRYKMWEDYFLMKYIQSKGYSWLEVFVPVTTVEPLTVAYGGISTKTKENEGAAMRLYGIKTPGAFFIEQLKFTLRDLFFAIRLGRTKWILYVIALHASYVKGYVAPNGHLT